jgi:hypothetical protein
MGKDTYSKMTPEQKKAYSQRQIANKKARVAKAAAKGEELLCSQAGTTKPLAAFQETLRNRLANPSLFGRDLDAVKHEADAPPRELLRLVKEHGIKLPTVSDSGLQERKKYWAGKSQAEKDKHYDYCNQKR